LQAWRAVIGIGHSWLSREIVAFSAFAGLAALAAAAHWIDPSGTVLGWPAAGVAGAVATAVGVVAVWCSVEVYAVTGRRWWRLDRTARAFGVTTVVGGASVATLVVAVASTSGTASVADVVRPLALLPASVAAFGLLADAWILRPGGRRDADLARSAVLMRGVLARLTAGRFAAGLLGGVVIPLLLVSIAVEEAPDLGVMRVLAGLGVLAVVYGELAGRQLFFRAMVAPRMPGIPR
jgi:DMSO reductase anchor subunit